MGDYKSQDLRVRQKKYFVFFAASCKKKIEIEVESVISNAETDSAKYAAFKIRYCGSSRVIFAPGRIEKSPQHEFTRGNQ
jgi:hypothetical protein